MLCRMARWVITVQEVVLVLICPTSRTIRTVVGTSAMNYMTNWKYAMGPFDEEIRTIVFLTAEHGLKVPVNIACERAHGEVEDQMPHFFGIKTYNGNISHSEKT